MGLLDSLKRWFSGEAAEVRESMDDAAGEVADAAGETVHVQDEGPEAAI